MDDAAEAFQQPLQVAGQHGLEQMQVDPRFRGFLRILRAAVPRHGHQQRALGEAVLALKDDRFFRDALGGAFVDYYVHIKNAEIERFQAEVSDWEQREYFGIF